MEEERENQEGVINPDLLDELEDDALVDDEEDESVATPSDDDDDSPWGMD